MLAAPRRLAGRLFAAAVVLAALVYGVFHWVTSLQWAAMGRAVEALRAAERARPSGRVLLRPSLAAGDPWSAYAAAVDSIGKPSTDAQTDFLRTGNASFREAAERESGGFATILADLARGARSDGPPDRERELRMREDPRRPTQIWGVAVVAAFAAVSDLDRGRPQAAVDRLLDLLQMTRDLAETELSALYYPTPHVWARLAIERMGRPADLGDAGLAALEDALTKLLESPPSLEAMLSRKLVFAGTRMHREGIGGWRKRVGYSPDRFPPGWRDGWSDRAQTLRSFTAEDRLLRDGEGLDAWSVERRREYWAEHERDERPWTSRPSEEDRSLLKGRLQLLLMRSAVRNLRSGVEDPGPDPWGRPLAHRQEGGRRTIWSLGSKGADTYGSTLEHRIEFAR